jgi:quercetin dioxygenase-like cupin family protein
MAMMERNPEAAIFRPEEGHRLEARGSEMFFKAVAASTRGRFSLMERSLPAGGRQPPMHIHVDTEEAFYVLEGEVSFRLGPEQERGGPGTFVLVPGGVSHTFGNTAASPARLLVLHVPAMDGYFEELAELWSGPDAPSREQEVDVMRRHGMISGSGA